MPYPKGVHQPRDAATLKPSARAAEIHGTRLQELMLSRLLARFCVETFQHLPPADDPRHMIKEPDAVARARRAYNQNLAKDRNEIPDEQVFADFKQEILRYQKLVSD